MSELRSEPMTDDTPMRIEAAEVAALVERTVKFCEQRAVSYGAVRRSALTAIALDEAIRVMRLQQDALASMSAEVERLRRTVRHLVDGRAGARAAAKAELARVQP